MHYLNKNVVLTGLLVSLDYESDTIAKFSMAVSTINSVVCEAYLFFIIVIKYVYSSILF